MFNLVSNLTKAAVGLIVETPIAIVRDIATLGGELTDGETATDKALNKILANLKKSTE
jgi:hypothetical protein